MKKRKKKRTLAKIIFIFMELTLSIYHCEIMRCIMIIDLEYLNKGS